jgi:predicted ATP-dependent endonuclease of OLD family
MQLLYIWIEDYKNIYRQGFNFSSQHRFEFIPEINNENKIDGELIKKEDNPHHIENFFGENITEITAIIGENGAGKSSLLESIGTILDNKYILVFKKFDTIYYESNTTFKTDIPKGTYYENQNERICYYNPYFTSESPTLSRGISNISTNGFVERQSLSNQSFYVEEIRRQSYFISSLGHQLSQFTFIPEEVYLFHSYSQSISSISLSEKLIEFVKGDISDNNFELKMKVSFILSVCIHRHLGGFKDKIEKIFTNITEKAIDRAITFISKLPITDSSNPINPKKLVESLKEMIEYLKSNKTQITYRDNGISFSFTNNDKKEQIDQTEPSEPFWKSLSYLHALPNDIPIFSFHYLKNDKMVVLSLGETALLNLFSRIYAYQNKTFHTFLIDEGELGFHPQWQKSYLKILIDVLPKIFSHNRIQIILTSHSPFFVSDLPKDNIIFLEKGNDGKCKVSSLKDHKDTFGANIHTLFTDSFFMKGGLIGDFATQKINSLIEILQKDITQIENDEDNIRKTIEMIGEPIIKRQLIKMLEDKMTLSAIGINKKINEMSKEMKRLEELYQELRKNKDSL